MGISSRRAVTGAATAMVLCLMTAGAAAAEGQPLGEKRPAMCDRPETWYAITSEKAVHVPSRWNGTDYKDGPGGTMSETVTKGGIISADVTGTGEFKAGEVIGEAKLSVSGRISASVTVTPGHTYSHPVGSRKYGHLQYGSWGYDVKWKRYRSGSGSGCITVELAHGSATLPTSAVGWRFWETSS